MQFGLVLLDITNLFFELLVTLLDIIDVRVAVLPCGVEEHPAIAERLPYVVGFVLLVREEGIQCREITMRTAGLVVHDTESALHFVDTVGNTIQSDRSAARQRDLCGNGQTEIPWPQTAAQEQVSLCKQELP